MVLVASLFMGCSKPSQPEPTTVAKEIQPPPTQNTNRLSKVGKVRRVSEFIGTLVAVDKQNQSVSIASGAPANAKLDTASVFLMTPETKVFKDEAPASLDDGVVGQEVRYGLRIRREDKKLLLTVLRFLANSELNEGK